jgi:Na+-driven multidrug efflux pump
MFGLCAVMLYTALNEALKTIGAKNMSLVTLLAGFGANALLDWVFLYTGAAHLFAAPESAIALATVLAQAFMASLSAWVFRRRIRARGIRFTRPGRADVTAEFRSAMLAGSGVGVRNVNDYTGSIVPMLFIGTMGVRTLAAAVVAANIYTVFCRVPQACFQATFVFYGYAVGREDPGRARIVRTLLNYAAVPTACAALVVVAISPWLVEAFASPGLDRGLTRMLLLAYLLYLPAYLLDQSFARMLTVHQRGAVLSTSSTLATYLLTIPLAWVAVFVLDSAFLAVACSGAAITVQAVAYWRTLRSELPARAEVLVA